jgi:hypothetical protein
VQKPHSRGRSGKFAHEYDSIKRHEQRIAHTGKRPIYWRYFIGATLLYALGIFLISRGWLYPALLIIACGGACFHIGLRQVEQHRTQLHHNALQKSAASARINGQPSYQHISLDQAVERYGTGTPLLPVQKGSTEPILIFQINARITRNDLQSYITGWESKLALQEPFGVLIVQYAEVSQSDQEMMQLSRQWHQTHKASVGQYCVGVAVTTTVSRLLESKVSATRAIRMWLGCPGKICATETEAKAWLTGQLEEKRKNSEFYKDQLC